MVRLELTKKGMKMPLYEIAIIEYPTEKQAEEGAIEKLIFGPAAVVASNPQTAGLKALKDHDMSAINLDRAQVLVRPFAKSQ